MRGYRQISSVVDDGPTHGAESLTGWLFRCYSTPIVASTNKVEAYNGFAKFLFFGGEGVIGEHDREEQEKCIKYNDLVANAVIFQNVVDMTYAIRDLMREGYPVTCAAVAGLSPYLTRTVKHFGEYAMNLDVLPLPLDGAMALTLREPNETITALPA